MRNRTSRLVFLFAMLLFAFLGQYTFAKRSTFFWDGVTYYSLSIVFMYLALRPAPSQEPSKLVPRPKLERDEIIRRSVVACAALFAVIVVALLTTHRESYWPVFWMWVASIVGYIGAFWYGHGVSGFGRGMIRKVSEHRWEIVFVMLLLAGAFALRGWHIDTIPWTLGGDEGSQGLWARDVIEGRLTNMFVTGWLSVPNMSFFFQAGWFRILGDNIVGLRLPWAIVGTFTILGSYLLVRRLFDRRLAFLVAFLLGTYHFHIHFSRLGSNQIADPLFTVWALYFLVLGWQSRKDWAWAASGIVAGLAFYFYAGSRQVPVILLAVLAWAMLTEPAFLKRHGKQLLIMLGGFLIAVAPMGLYFLQHPDDFNARLNQVGVIQSGWLEREVEMTGKSAWVLMAEQFKKAFFAFNLYKDRVVWYGAEIPLMDFLSSIFFILGGALAAGKSLRIGGRMSGATSEGEKISESWRCGVFVIWLALVITLGGALTENPPSSQRLVSSAVPAIFFAAFALRSLTTAVAEVVKWPEWGRQSLVGAFAVVIAVISLRYYFGPYQDSRVYGSFNGEVATRIGYYLRELGPTWQEYFFGAPRMYADFGSTPFIAKGVPLYDVQQPLNSPPTFVNPEHNAVFVFLPERMAELDIVQQAYPGGRLERVYRDDDPSGALYFAAYLVEG